MYTYPYVSTYITAQGCVGLGALDLGQILGQRVLVFGLFIVGCVVELQQTENGVRVEAAQRSWSSCDHRWLQLYLAD